MSARIIALGNACAGDDGAAIEAARRLEAELEVTLAGRPGAGLLEIFDGRPTVLVDVTRSGQRPGRIMTAPLAQLTGMAIAESSLSSHGFGPAESLRLAAALGRPLPAGTFVGIEGERFDVGQGLSAPVAVALDEFVAAIRRAAERLDGA